VDAIWYRLNIWTQQGERWLPVDHWAACGAATDEGELRGEPCYAGLDLASTSDLCAFVPFFPSCGHAILPYFWVPQETVNALEAKGSPSYATWKR
jgi:phage terminase large subunit-like protein